MPIESDIPMEIDQYQKKIVFGLTLRQLICLILALLLGGGAYSFCALVLGLNADSAGWLVMLAAAPALAVGFLQPYGEPFERYFLRTVRRLYHPNRLYYAARPGLAPDQTTRKGGAKHGADPSAHGAENTCRFRRTRAGRKRKRKQTARCIQTAEKECRAAAARAKKETGRNNCRA